ncbi:hypothetical protein ANCDUO_05305 [Ancylostoma duodenale]|uniref:Uncharacterized protein n=1 Tax=Ancylostoma duodenale TaxID=51022 RepID=A0A0C2H4V3_9BILA|nr:hypothetical protein ANCDUO_05305 [Ancylostoma duodenale]
MLNCDHPPLAKLIKALKDLDLEAKCALHRLERMPHEGKELRKRLRRQRIDEEMAR